MEAPTEDDEEQGSRRRLVLVVALVAAAAACAATVLVFIEDKGTYSKSVEELVAHRASYVGKPVRVEGLLVHGSYDRKADGCDHRFRIGKNGAEIPVRYAGCAPPDNLRDAPGIDVEVTVEGTLDAQGSFGATQVLTKCPSKYKEQELAARGEKRPH